MTQQQERITQRELKKERRRRVRRRRRLATASMVTAAFLLGCICGVRFSSVTVSEKKAAQTVQTAESAKTELSQTTTGQADGTEKTAKEIAEELNGITAAAVSKPVDYSYREALSVLSGMADSDSRYGTIAENAADYPEKLLINLANNPEMLGFVAQYSGISYSSADASLTEDELNVKCPLFLQWDKRWGAHSYGDESNIAVSGCGPTTLAMAVVALTGNADATPAAVADFAMNEGYYMYGTGTRWSLMTDGAASYGLTSEQIDVDEQAMKACIDAGGLVICSMRKDDFTTAGHFIILYDYDSEGFSLNDPFCAYRSGQKWNYDSLKKQMKAAWTVYA